MADDQASATWQQATQEPRTRLENNPMDNLEEKIEPLIEPALAYGSDTMAALQKQFAETEYNIRTLLKNIARISATQGVPPSDS